MGEKKEKLNPRQKAFVREYLKCRNGAEAARRAGYSKKTAHEQAAQLLAKLSISRLVKANEEKVQAEFEVTQASIIRELAAVAFGNVGEVVDEDGRIVGDGRILAGFSKSSSRGDESDSDSFSVSAHNKVKALELLGKHVGMWRPVKDDPDGSGEGSSERNRQSVLQRVSELMRKRARRGEPPTDGGA